MTYIFRFFFDHVFVRDPLTDSLIRRVFTSGRLRRHELRQWGRVGELVFQHIRVSDPDLQAGSE